MADASASINDVFDGANVVVTGAAGQVGTFVCAHLADRYDATVTAIDRKPWDGNPAASNLKLEERLPLLRMDLADSEKLQPVIDAADVVLHMAGATVGIGASATSGYTLLHENAELDLGVLGAVRRRSSTAPLSLVAISSSCVYPTSAPQPIPESAASMECEVGNEGYGFAKLLLERSLHELHREASGFTPAVFRLANAYGESYRFKGEANSHLIPALVWKGAKGAALNVWGDGSQQRDFVHASDIAEVVLRFAALAVRGGEPVGPVNFASGTPRSVRDIAEHVVARFGLPGIEYDTTKPSGNKAKTLDLTAFRRVMGDWEPTLDFAAGLDRMIDVWLPYVQDHPAGA